MKDKITINKTAIVFVLFILLIKIAVSQRDICTGSFQSVVSRNDTIVVECDKLVLMNAETFARYWHDSKQLDELREEIPEWSVVIDSLHKVHEVQRLELDSITSIQVSKIDTLRQANSELIDMVVATETKSKKLSKKNEKLTKVSVSSVAINLILLVFLL